MHGNQIRKNAAGAVIHNDINNYPLLNIPMIINAKDGMIYEVFIVGFHANDADTPRSSIICTRLRKLKLYRRYHLTINKCHFNYKLAAVGSIS